MPLAERLPALGPPLYEAILGALGPHASYPPDFTSWRCCYEGADEESWGRMREQVLPEALDVAYCLLRMAYLTRAWELLRGARSWQDAEAALFLVKSVALGVRTRVMADSAAAGAARGEGATPAALAAARDRLESRALLLSLFEQLCGSSEAQGRWVGGPAPLARGAASLIDAFSPWFAKDPDAPLHGALQLLVLALGVPEVRCPVPGCLPVMPGTRCCLSRGLAHAFALAALTCRPASPRRRPLRTCASGVLGG